MRTTFYYDDQPDGNNLLLRLDNPNLIDGYCTHLRRSLSEERQQHVRVKLESVDDAGELHGMGLSLREIMVHENA